MGNSKPQLEVVRDEPDPVPEAPRPRAPAGLQARGRRYWDAVLDEYDPAPSELELLVEVCRTLDLVERLDRAVRKEGPVTLKRTVHPAVGEARQQRLVLHRLLAALKLPGPEAIDSPATIRARRAAESRWKGHRRRGELE